jgi:phosphate transport system substrate-binding protein
MENYMNIKWLLLFASIIPALLSCNPAPKNTKTSDGIKGKISISGAFALYPMTVKWAEEFQKLHPDVRIDISAGGAGKGITDVLSGMVDLAMVSREISPSEVDKGAWYLAVTKDAVLPTINSRNPAAQDILQKGFTLEIFQEIYLQDKQHKWGDYLETKEQGKINVYTRSDACGAAEMWGKYLGKNQESLMGIGVFGDPGIADAVKNDVYGIGYNNVIYAYDIASKKRYFGIEIIPIDLNGNRVIDPEENFYDNLETITDAIQSGKYPSPPARDLYLVSLGKPTNLAVIAFLEWILGEGQQYVHEGGYVQLTNEKISEEKLKIR